MGGWVANNHSRRRSDIESDSQMAQTWNFVESLIDRPTQFNRGIPSMSTLAISFNSFDTCNVVPTGMFRESSLFGRQEAGKC